MRFHAKKVFGNENGAALVTALLVLVILTIMGVMAMNIRNVEVSIAKNSEVFQKNFYAVEAVTLEGAAKINKAVNDETDGFDLLNTYPPWLGVVSDPPAFDYTFSNQWTQPAVPPPGIPVPEDTALNAGLSNIVPLGYTDTDDPAGDRIWYVAQEELTCGSTSGSLTSGTQVEKCYNVYGMYDVKRGAGKTYTGRMMLNVGYHQLIYGTP